MLDRLMSPVARARLRALAARWVPGTTPATSARPAPGAASRTTILPGLDTRPAPMRPLHPPAALNDNPLREIHDAVERDLRANGHLR